MCGVDGNSKDKKGADHVNDQGKSGGDIDIDGEYKTRVTKRGRRAFLGQGACSVGAGAGVDPQCNFSLCADFAVCNDKTHVAGILSPSEMGRRGRRDRRPSIFALL